MLSAAAQSGTLRLSSPKSTSSAIAVTTEMSSSVGATASNAALVSTEKTNTNGLMMNKAGDHVVSTAAAKFRLNASDMPTASDDILYSLTHCYYTKE